MKRAVIISSIVIWSLVGVILLTVLVSALTGFTFFGLTDRFKINGRGVFNVISGGKIVQVDEKNINLSGVNELNISGTYQSMRVTLVDGDTLTVKHFDNEGHPGLELSESAGSVSIGTQRYSFTINFGISIESPRLEVYLPKSYASAIGLRNTSGSIKVEESVNWGDTAVSTSSGSIRFEYDSLFGNTVISSTSGSIKLENGLSCGDLAISSSSGSIRLGNVNARSVSVISTSGSQRVMNINCEGQINMGASSGSVEIENIQASGFSVRHSSGSIKLGNVDVTGSADIETTSGSIRVNALRTGSFSVKSSSGSVNLAELSGGGRIEASSGSLTIDRLTLLGNIDIRRSSGSVKISLVSGQAINADVTTSSGSIHTNLPLRYDQKGKNGSCQMEGAQYTLSVKTNSGSVRID